MGNSFNMEYSITRIFLTFQTSYAKPNQNDSIIKYFGNFRS